MKPAKSHRDLLAWQRAVSLASAVYALTKALPQDDSLDLASSLRRAAVSVATHIAEGVARRRPADFLESLHAARCSLADLETQILIAVDQRLLAQTDGPFDKIFEVGELLQNLTDALLTARQRAHADACAPILVRGRTHSHSRVAPHQSRSFSGSLDPTSQHVAATRPAQL